MNLLASMGIEEDSVAGPALSGAAVGVMLSMLMRMMKRGYRKHWLADEDQPNSLLHPFDLVAGTGGAAVGAGVRAARLERENERNRRGESWQP